MKVNVQRSDRQQLHISKTAPGCYIDTVLMLLKSKLKEGRNRKLKRLPSLAQLAAILIKFPPKIAWVLQNATTVMSPMAQVPASCSSCLVMRDKGRVGES
jgi:hypothetical protein